MSVLTIENLAKTYGDRPVFTNVPFSLEAGEKAAFFGPNGSGKTTILRIIAASSIPTEAISGSLPACVWGICPRYPPFPAGSTLASFLEAPGTAGGRTPGEARRRFGLAADAGETPLHKFSSGRGPGRHWPALARRSGSAASR